MSTPPLSRARSEMNKMRKYPQRRLPTATVIMLTVLLTGCSPPEERTAAPLSVEVAQARPAASVRTVSGIGTVAREHEAELAFTVPGSLMNLRVDVGDRIRRGQILGRLDATDIEARLASANSDVDQAQRTANRYARLAETGAVARSVYQDALTRLDQMRAAHRQAAFDLRSATLIAPVQGIVLERVRQAGETLSAGQAVLSVADLGSPLIARVPLAPEAVADVRVGDQASAHFDTLHKSVAGRVTRIGRLASGATGTIEVEVTLPETTGLTSGLLGTITLTVGAQASVPDPGAVRIPIEALVMSDDRVGVFTIEGKQPRAILTRLRFLRFDGEDAVVSGLSEGTRVITSGAGYVKNGQIVQLSEGVTE